MGGSSGRRRPPAVARGRQRRQGWQHGPGAVFRQRHQPAFGLGRPHHPQGAGSAARSELHLRPRHACSRTRWRWTAPSPMPSASHGRRSVSLPTLGQAAVGWADESHRLAQQVAYNDIAKPSGEAWSLRYQAKAWPVVKTRLEQAGVRLAAVLNAASGCTERSSEHATSARSCCLQASATGVKKVRPYAAAAQQHDATASGVSRGLHAELWQLKASPRLVWSADLADHFAGQLAGAWHLDVQMADDARFSPWLGGQCCCYARADDYPRQPDPPYQDRRHAWPRHRCAGHARADHRRRRECRAPQPLPRQAGRSPRTRAAVREVAATRRLRGRHPGRSAGSEDSRRDIRRRSGATGRGRRRSCWTAARACRRAMQPASA